MGIHPNMHCLLNGWQDQEWITGYRLAQRHSQHADLSGRGQRGRRRV